MECFPSISKLLISMCTKSDRYQFSLNGLCCRLMVKWLKLYVLFWCMFVSNINTYVIFFLKFLKVALLVCVHTYKLICKFCTYDTSYIYQDILSLKLEIIVKLVSSSAIVFCHKCFI